MGPYGFTNTICFISILFFVVFSCFMGILHKYNDFYTVQTVYSIPLH